MRKLVIGGLVALAAAGATGGVLVVNTVTNATDEVALNSGSGGSGAPVRFVSDVPGSRLVVSPDPVNRFGTVRIDAFCENGEVEGVFSDAFPGGVTGRHVEPGHFEGTAVADPAHPGTFEVEAGCGNGGPVTATIRVLGDG